ncbi:FtsJ-like methyltransferase-domain-containing protein [Hypoxylon fuscum]|nr:FtsJ-like methyltransferase-domain-containing protein [Hypoxylon fuscum]
MSPEFRELDELRQRGWKNPDGDTFFQKQRRNADNCDDRSAVHFYNMMKRIGQELHKSTHAFATPKHHSRQPRILDMCMAPGGFLEVALSKTPGAEALAFSLPIASGGHKVFLRTAANVEQRFLDITMLAVDMGVEEIPEDHPDASRFLSRHFKPDQLFDLVLCDGQVLRTHERAAYRENREARRLMVTQLALGLGHLQPGGTMVVLLHKLEKYDTANLVRTFSNFSSVRLFKPKSSHTIRSSFYMVATNVQSNHPEAIRAVESWKATWKAATFRTDEEYQQVLHRDEGSVGEILQEFGQEMVSLGRDIWKVQIDGLAKAPFIQDRKKESAFR